MRRSDRLVILTDIASPYRLPVFRHLASLVDLHVVLLAEGDRFRNWETFSGDGSFAVHVLKPAPLTQRISVGRMPVHLVRGTGKTLRALNPEAVVIGGWNQPSFWAAMRPKTPWKMALWVESNARDSRPQSRVRELAKRLALRRSDCVVVPGSASSDYVRGLGYSKEIIRAPNAVDVSFFGRQRDTQPIRSELRDQMDCRQLVCFVADVSFAKGIDLALNAMARVRGDVGIVVLGIGPEIESWRQHARRIGLNDRARFEGFVSAERVATVLSASDLMLFPTRSDTWGLAINEAQAAGCPVISSYAAGAVDDLLTDGAGVCLELDELLWARTIEEILGDDERRRAMAEKGRLMAARHTPEACAAGLASVLS
jgi:glycosyltransferase involved in cell wall biosynthesis